MQIFLQFSFLIYAEMNFTKQNQALRVANCYVCRIGAVRSLTLRDLQPNASKRMHNAYKVYGESSEL